MISYVENETDISFEFNEKQIVEMLMDEVLTMEKCPYEAQVNLLITDDQGIREFNRDHRNIDKATDVLSFPMIEFENAGDFSVVENHEADYFDPESGELLLGDIILSADKIIKQAEEFGHSIKREFAFLVTHSLLHLCGYDHMEDEERTLMEKKQNEILDKVGITRDI
ncbi:MAG: rRNA maturation RNase YbeY [Lachnospiraceae bacterium]|nr:rRNA maturation RNase YbeY [Lachnospiraceae bacterium]